MKNDEINILLAGDVMLGRGIDQILPYPGDPKLHETWRQVGDAGVYVDLSQKRYGSIPDIRDTGYIWGDILAEIEALDPDLRLINLETAVTCQGSPWPNKRIHYRMNPRNIDVLKHAKIDFCALANNHVLDWGYAGLDETITTLDKSGIRYAGAGESIDQAGMPAILPVNGKGRIIVISMATTSSGVPVDWGAGHQRGGMNLVDLNEFWINRIRDSIAAIRQPGDITVASIHWGGNFGHEIHPNQRHFAHKLITESGIDLIHGHSSHHVREVELYEGKLVMYGCGDLINDYEGIPKKPENAFYEPDLGLLYFAKLSASNGKLRSLEIVPTHMQQRRLMRGNAGEARRLSDILNREGTKSGTSVAHENNILRLCI